MGIEMNAGFVGLKCSEVVDLVTLWVKSCGLASDLINIILIAGLRQCILSSQQLTYKWTWETQPVYKWRAAPAGGEILFTWQLGVGGKNVTQSIDLWSEKN